MTAALSTAAPSPEINRLTIACYHYVRDLKRSRFPEIKALDVGEFRHQIRYFTRFYQFVTAADVAAAVSGARPLPPRALLLTFDDGYADHYQFVFPVLDQMQVSACFYPPVEAVRDGRLLDVNKIHFILAAAPIERVSAEMFSLLARLRSDHPVIPADGQIRREFGVPGRLDSLEVNLVKRFLQKGLPLALRNRVVDELFRRFVSADESAFARELYLTEDQIRCMLRHGMHFGSHGHSHQWLNTLSPVEQASEIDQSFAWLASLGATRDFWSMCYPYGGYNHDTVALMESRRCAFALTVDQGLAQLSPASRYVLRRLDTNAFPKSDTQEPNEWTRSVLTAN